MGNLTEVDEDEGHDCLDNIETSFGGLRCSECGEPIDVADAECTWCGRFPCGCDDAYERLKEDRLERGY